MGGRIGNRTVPADRRTALLLRTFNVCRKEYRVAVKMQSHSGDGLTVGFGWSVSTKSYCNVWSPTENWAERCSTTPEPRLLTSAHICRSD